MSHTATIKTALTDPSAVAEAAETLGATVKRNATAKLYDGGRATGTVIEFQGWTYPVIVTDEGQLVYDDYNGRWGNIDDLQSLKQEYAVVQTTRTMGHNWQIQREAKEDGSLRLTLHR